ncbi:MAG: LarC family nickel insertion protein, partial [Ardenticatenaceae bacterium]
FHEVGALDSIIDIVGVCAGLGALEVKGLYAGPLPAGSGFVSSQHGQLPLPAPATLELLARANAPIRAAPGSEEFVTPTGAALVTHFVQDRWRQPAMRLQRIALGAGQRDFEWPNVARLWLGEPFALSEPSPPGVVEAFETETGLYTADAGAEPLHRAVSTLIETNIDDMNPELYEAVAGALFANGARDVWWTPIQMKKSRPAIKLSVLAPKAQEARMAQIILQETTTLGVRLYDVRGYAAERRFEQVETPFGPIPVKLKILDSAIIAAMPEFESCKSAALQHGVPTRRVYEAATALAWQLFLQPSESYNSPENRKGQ